MTSTAIYIIIKVKVKVITIIRRGLQQSKEQSTINIITYYSTLPDMHICAHTVLQLVKQITAAEAVSTLMLGTQSCMTWVWPWLILLF